MQVCNNMLMPRKSQNPIIRRWQDLRGSPELDNALRSLKTFGVNNLLTVGAVIITLSLIYNTTNSIERNAQLQTEENELNAGIELLEQEIRLNKLLGEYYASDEYLELETRKQLGLVSPGEKVILVDDVFDRSETVEQLPEDEIITDDRPQYKQNLEAWYNYFFNK